MAHTRQSWPDSGPGVWSQFTKPCKLFPIGSGSARVFRVSRKAMRAESVMRADCASEVFTVEGFAAR